MTTNNPQTHLYVKGRRKSACGLTSQRKMKDPLQVSCAKCQASPYYRAAIERMKERLNGSQHAEAEDNPIDLGPDYIDLDLGATPDDEVAFTITVTVYRDGQYSIYSTDHGPLMSLAAAAMSAQLEKATDAFLSA